jgi:hypothetical protein
VRWPVTEAKPIGWRQVIFHTPLLIAVLIVGTGYVLWRIAKPRPPEQ